MSAGYEIRLFINGEYVTPSSQKQLVVTNPNDESVLATILSASAADVEDAVNAADAAYKGEWSTWTAGQREAALHRLADLIVKNAAELASLESNSMGQPISHATALLRTGADICRYYAGWANKINGEQYPVEGDGPYTILTYEPLGVCAGIGAWNASLLFLLAKSTPALAAGNTFIYKGSEKSPLGALAMGRLFAKAGFPPGVMNIISGAGDIGALLAAHPKIRKISFTGSVPVGKKIQEAAAGNLKRVTLELGGKSPAIVFEDANLKNAITVCSDMFLFNTSQACIATSRVFVHESIAREFTAGVKARFETLQSAFGNPMDEKTIYGPLVDKSQFDRVKNYIDIGKQEAELAAGGDVLGDKGHFIQPTLFLNPGDNARIYKEEIFGPVLTVRTFKTEDEVVKLANDTVYGLSASILTSSIPRALRVSRKIESGRVVINGPPTTSHISASFGGFKESGLGRELGREGIMGYLQSKSVLINMSV